MRMFRDYSDNDEEYTTAFESNALKQKNLEIDSLKFKLENLNNMLLNVCENVYKLKAGWINDNQLLSIVNGCLDEKVIDRFNWYYLLTKEEKEQSNKKLAEQIKAKYLNDNEVDNLKLDEIDEEASPVIERQDDGRYKIRYDLAYDSLSPLWPKDSLYKGNLPDEVLLKGLNEDAEGCLSSSQIEEAIESGDINLNKFNMSDWGTKQEFGLSKEDLEKILYNQDVMKILKDIIDLVNNK